MVERRKQVQLARDEKRVEVIGSTLRPLVDKYLRVRLNSIPSNTQIDSINKRNEYWGFKGIKGQMFFNMIVNIASDPEEIDQELKSALVVPGNEKIGASRIRTFNSYVRRLGEEHVAVGGSARGKPKPSSIPFFLSYFWQIQDPDSWPVYFTNSVNVMGDLNLWKPGDDLADAYLT